MDGFTQGAIGAAAAQVVFGRRLGRWALPIGWLAGMLPDADIFVRSASDPLLGWTFHRSISHALIFVPIGALIATLPFLLSPTLRTRVREVYGAAFLAVLTHGLLDAQTSYGTQLFWPFTDQRVAWDSIAIIDPIFTITLLVGVVLSTLWRSASPARWAMAGACLYLGLGFYQHSRAADAQAQLAAYRGHGVEAGRVMPSVGNMVLYRSLYRTDDGEMYADAIRVPFFGAATVREGESVTVYEPDDDMIAEARDPARMRRDLRRFEWFTSGYWAKTPGNEGMIGDMRIAADPASMAPFWGISLAAQDPVPVQRQSRSISERGDIDFGGFWREIWGDDKRHRPPPGTGSDADLSWVQLPAPASAPAPAP